MIPTSTARGFTDHEHLDSVGLIHMNGRVYDPELGRFMSADPFVQAPYNSQSYNRYSYVFNNPLSFTDPSGYTTDCNNQNAGSGHAPGGDCVEETTTYGDRDALERQRQQDAMTNSNNANWFASESRNQQWAYMNGAAYNIASFWGMTEFALAAGGNFPDALRKEITNVRPMDVLDFIARGDGLLQGAVLDASRIKVTSPYNALRGGKVHVGVDLTGHDSKGNKVLGVNVLSGTSGIVAAIWRNINGLGYGISIQTGKLFYTYAHFKSAVVGFKIGESVKVGEVLGRTGCSDGGTRSCSGEHLHLQIKDTLSLGGNSYSPGVEYNQKGWLQ